MTKAAPTKTKPSLTFARLFGALLLAAVAIPQAQSAPAFAGEVCNNADLQGAYLYSVDGTALTNPPPLGPVDILGRITLDGRGNFAGTVNGSVAGVFILDNEPVTGTYSIAADCTGSWTTNYGPAPSLTFHWSIVLVEDIDGRKHAELVGTDTGGVSTGTVKPMFAPAQNAQ